MPVNDASFLRKDDGNEQDVFFHKLFVERAQRDDINKGEDEMEHVVMEAAEGAEWWIGTNRESGCCTFFSLASILANSFVLIVTTVVRGI